MGQKIIWFLLFVISATIVFFFFVIRAGDANEQEKLLSNDVTLDGDVQSTLEVYENIYLKWVGTKKHLDMLQKQTDEHIEVYNAKMDSIGDHFLRVENDLDNMKELLLKKIDELDSDLSDFKDIFNSYKRATNRKIDDIQISELPRINSEVKWMSDSLNLVLELEIIRKDLDKLLRKMNKEE